MSPGIVVLLVAIALFVGYLIGRQQRSPKAEPFSVKSPPRELDREALAEIRELLSTNRKIEAIKRCREITGYGLKEAKDMVEQLEQREQ